MSFNPVEHKSRRFVISFTKASSHRYVINAQQKVTLNRNMVLAALPSTFIQYWWTIDRCFIKCELVLKGAIYPLNSVFSSSIYNNPWELPFDWQAKHNIFMFLLVRDYELNLLSQFRAWSCNMKMCVCGIDSKRGYVLTHCHQGA